MLSDVYTAVNIALSLAIGAALGLWWAVKTGRPRMRGGATASLIVLILSPMIRKDGWFVYLNGYGLMGNLTLLGFMAMVMLMASRRRLWRSRTASETSA